MTVQRVAILYCSCPGGIELATIFTVDDERAIIEVYRDILITKDHEVVAEAYDGEEAVNKFKVMDRKPDVIIMDHRMPQKNGIDAMKEIHGIDPMQCVIFVTADYEAAKNAILMGANSFILKPFRMDDLFNSIGATLWKLEEKKSKIRETLLGIVSKYRDSNPQQLAGAFDIIEKEVIDEYLKKHMTSDIDIEKAVGWSCAFFNLCGFQYEYDCQKEGSIVIKNKHCYWMEKFGEEPIFCNLTKGIITRFAMKSGQDVVVNTHKTLMNHDDCCHFEVQI